RSCGGKHNRAVWSPGTATRPSAVLARQRDRRAARHCHLFQRGRAVEVSDPPPVWRHEHASGLTYVANANGLELVQRADKELLACSIVAYVDDGAAVGSDDDITIETADGQGCRPRCGDGGAHDGGRRWPSERPHGRSGNDRDCDRTGTNCGYDP